MTLEELLALLPDNDTGAIDAADLRTIVTELWDDGAAEDARTTSLEARVAALEAAGGGGTTVSVTGRWQVNPTGGVVPGGKQVSASSDEWALATWLRFDPHDMNNVDQTNVLSTATTIFGQQQQDSGNWARHRVTGPVTVGAGYVEVPVELVSSHGSIAAAQWQEAQFVFQVPVTP